MKVVVKSGKLSRETLDAAGFDVYARGNHTLRAGEGKMIPTGLVTEMTGCFGKLFDRSGKAKVGLTTRAGVIDADYNQEWHVIVRYEPPTKSFFQRVREWWFGDVEEIIEIKDGERIAQVVFFPQNFVNVTAMNDGRVEIKYHERQGGFGSTGG